jgi:hypothetical protein
MELSFVMDSLDGVPAEVASLYEKGDGDKFVLTGIGGIASKSRVDEFRTSNVNLKAKLEKFDGIDVKDVEETKVKLEEAIIRLENVKEADDETINKLVDSRVAKISETAQEAADKDANTISTLQRQLESLIIDGETTKGATKHKVSTDAITDVLLRVKSVFKLVEGKPVATKDGTKLYAADGTSDLTISEYIKSLTKTSPHLFQQSVGSRIPNQGGNRFKGDPTKLTPVQKINAGLG